MSEEFLDSSVIESLQEIMGEDFSLLITTFVADSVRRLEQLKHFHASSSPDELRRVAHSLKGSAGNVGAFRLANYCSVVEEIALTGVLDQLDGQVNTIAEELERVNRRLEQLL